MLHGRSSIMVKRVLTGVVAALAIATVLPLRAATQLPSWSTAGGPILAQSPELTASLQRLHSGSAAWRDALTALAATGRRAIVVTPDHVRVRDPKGESERPFDDDVLAEVQPLADEDARVEVVVVVVPLYQNFHYYYNTFLFLYLVLHEALRYLLCFCFYYYMFFSYILIYIDYLYIVLIK